jgi:hypothetical protein
MPYAPGIQDISGQLIAQGMSQAGAARARAIESLGESISGGIKQYQQNQLFTNQALGKFGQQLQDPDFKNYVNQVVNDDPNAPKVPDALKKAFKNAAAGKVDIYDAALLGTATEGYQQNKTQYYDQLLKLANAAQILQKSQPKTPQYMSQADLLSRFPTNQYVVTGAKPVVGSPGVLDVSEIEIKTREEPTPTVVGATGGTVLGPGGTRTIVQPLIQPPPGYMLEGGEMGAAPQAAPTASISPAALAPFAAAGRMAPAAGGLLAQVGPQAAPAVSPQTAEAIRAVQPQAAPARPTTAAPSGPRLVPIPGSQAAQEAQAKRQAEVANYQLQMQNFDVVLGAIDKVLGNVNARSTGIGSLLKHIPSTKANQVAADLRPILAQNAFEGLGQLKEAGLTLGQVAIYEIRLLENARLALNQEGSAKDFADALKNLRKTTQNSKKRLEILARDRKSGLEIPSEEYFKLGGYWPGVSKEMPAADGAESAGGGGGNVMRLNVQRGSAAGTSTLKPAEFDFSAYEGKVLQRPDGKRVRIVNGKEVPLQ